MLLSMLEGLGVLCCVVGVVKILKKITRFILKYNVYYFFEKSNLFKLIKFRKKFIIIHNIKLVLLASS